MLAIIVPEGPPTSSGARKSPSESTNAKVAARQQSWQGKRQDHAQKSFERTGTQVLRRFHQRTRNVFQRRINRQKNKRACRCA